MKRHHSDLVRNIAEGIRAMTRFGVEISEEMIEERARNIAAQMIVLHGASLDELPDEEQEAA
jgi:hypothetical protein